MTSGPEVLGRFASAAGNIAITWLDQDGRRLHSAAGRRSALAVTARLERTVGHGRLAVLVDVRDLPRLAVALRLTQDEMRALMPATRETATPDDAAPAQDAG
jgi:hypothetical protein